MTSLKSFMCGKVAKVSTLGILTLMILFGHVHGQQKVYWTDGLLHEVRRANLNGSDIQLVAFGVSGMFGWGANGLAIDPVEGLLFWGNNHSPSSEIMRGDLDGRNQRAIVQSSEGAAQMAVDVKHRKLYWTGAGKIKRANLDGSDLEIIYDAMGDGSPNGIAIDTAGGKVYWSDTRISDRIRRANLDGSDAETILEYPAVDFYDPRGIALDTQRGKIYWGDRSAIHRSNLDGSDIEVVASAGIGGVQGIAVDAEAAKMYWTDPLARNIKRANLDGSAMETLVAQNVYSPREIMLDLRGHLPRVSALRPNDDASGVSTSPVLEWVPLTGAQEYVVQAFRDTTLSELVVSDTTDESTFAFVAPLAETRYFWRVRGLQPGESGPWSYVRSFTTGSTGPLAPKLLFPDRGATRVDTNLTFVWSEAAEASRYRLQVSTDPGFEFPLKDTVLVMQTSMRMDSLNFDRTYYWRVRGQTEEGFGTWSATYEFTTRGAMLEAVTLANPENGSSGVSGLPTLTWNVLLGATRYRLQIAADTSFDQVVVNDSSLTGTQYTPVEALTYSSTYYWRVRGSDGTAWGAWSATWHFETGLGTNTEEPIETRDFVLQVYPNPATESATITIETAETENMTMAIWDVTGRKLDTIFDGWLAAGSHRLKWDGNRFAAGVYFLRVDTRHKTFSKAIVLSR